MGSDLPLFARLNVCACATLGLTIAEYLVSHYTHSITLLVCANQSLYNLLSLIFGAVSIAVSTYFFLYHKSLMVVDLVLQANFLLITWNVT